MRVIDRGPTRRRLPDVRPPKQISPRGFATDLTPARHVASAEPLHRAASKADRGAAMLERGSFNTFLKQHDNRLQPEERRAVNMLKKNRNDLLKPGNAQHLALLQRTQPGTDLYNHIHADPHTSTQHKLLLGGINVPADARLKMRQSGLTNDQIDQMGAGQLSGDQAVNAIKATHVAAAKAQIPEIAKRLNVDPSTVGVNQAGGIVTPAAGDIVSKFFQGAMDTVIGLPALGYDMATNDPRKTIPQLGKAVGSSFADTVTHPLRQLQKDPFAFTTNLTAIGGAGIGVAGRLGAAGEAASAARAGSAAAADTSLIPERVAEQAATMNPARAAVHGFTHPAVRTVLDAWEHAHPSARLAEEDAGIAAQVQKAADQIVPRVKGTRAKMIHTAREVREGMAATRASDAAHPHELMTSYPGSFNRVTSNIVGAGGAGLRELSDGVRAGTIYLRPAYLPNNWAGNVFMNLTHQGAYAPINLAKSVMMHRYLNPRELRMLHALGGQTSMKAIAGGAGKGYIRSLTQPLVEKMSAVADQPFRDAAVLHEFRREGYKSLEDVKQALRKADGNEAEMQKLATKVGRPAQEQVVKFTKLSDTERSVIRNLVFVWNWTKGATRYAVRFPLEHPLQTAAYQAGARSLGTNYIRSHIGGLPPYLTGNIPVGHGKLSNPFSLNPLGTAVQVGQAAQGTAKELMPGTFGQFDPHTMNDYTSLGNPILVAALQAREQSAGRSFSQNVVRNIGAYKLYEGLRHPGSGGIFPGTKAEALGHFILGSLYPRKYDPQAISAALERMNINHPEALIPEQLAKIEKATGQKVDPRIVTAYRKDIVELQHQKDFKKSYAQSHNMPSYKRLPPQNQLESALQYLDKYGHVPKEEINNLRAASHQFTTDDEFRSLANAAWSMTAAGEGKKAWQALMSQVKAGQLTRKR